MNPSRFLNLTDHSSPATKYPRRRLGCAEVASYKIHRGTYRMYQVNGYGYYVAKQRLKGTELIINRKVWMVDDPPHWLGMIEHAQKYSGHVLCAGLGLGLIVHALQDNPRVKNITVIERERDVIDLIKPLVPQKNLTVLHGDFWDLDPWVMDKVDGVFYDLFVGKGEELFPQAMRVWIQLSEMWPHAVRRIFGFPNVREVGTGRSFGTPSNPHDQPGQSQGHDL